MGDGKPPDTIEDPDMPETPWFVSAMGFTLAACTCAIILSLTYRIIQWILGY